MQEENPDMSHKEKNAASKNKQTENKKKKKTLPVVWNDTSHTFKYNKKQLRGVWRVVSRSGLKVNENKLTALQLKVH